MALKEVSSEVVYDDLQVGINNIAKGGVAPSDRTYACGIGGGIAFPFLGFAVNDYIFFDVQTSHSMKLNTILDLHIHYILPNTTNINDRFRFQLDVIAAGLDGTYAVPTGSPYTSAEHLVASGDNTNHKLLEIADIAAVNTTVSTVYHCKLTRVAATTDDYAGEVYISYIDCHYQKDTHGSYKEGSKF